MDVFHKESLGYIGGLLGASTAEPIFGGVPTTPDPDTSAKVSGYKWEAYRDTNWWCILGSQHPSPNVKNPLQI